jgi:hypothetical protein
MSKPGEYSEEDYEEGFEEDAAGEDEMEKIRKAMEREKLKAQKFQERQAIPKPQKIDQSNPLKMNTGAGQSAGPNLQSKSNMDGFVK